MIDLRFIKHVYVYPGKTDFRLGINRLRQCVGPNAKPQSLYVFCNANITQIKILEVEENAIWLYQKKLLKKKFMYPQKGNTTSISTQDLKAIIDGINLINKIEGVNSIKNVDLY